jgi:hypothetical protein
MMRLDRGAIWASDGAPAPSATFSVRVVRRTASGSPMATMYQRSPTRQRIIREPSSFNPARPWMRGITMRAAMSGPAGKNPNALIGRNPHESA